MKKIILTAAAALMTIATVHSSAEARGFGGGRSFGGGSFGGAARSMPSFKPMASPMKFSPGKINPGKINPGKIKFPPGKLTPKPFPGKIDPGKIKFPPGKLDPTFPPGKGPKPPGKDPKPPGKDPKPPGKPPEAGHGHKGKYWVWGGITILATEYAGCGYEYYKWQSTGSQWWYARYAQCRGWM